LLKFIDAAWTSNPELGNRS